jgi:hypothetical protein
MSLFDYSAYCIKRLFLDFPELKDDPRYKEEINEANNFEKKAHDLYERVFCHYVLDLIQQQKIDDKEKIKKAFDLIEQLAQHAEFEVRCVAEVSFIEPFTCYLEPMKDVEKYLGPKSLEMAREIAHERYGRNPNTWERE